MTTWTSKKLSEYMPRSGYRLRELGRLSEKLLLVRARRYLSPPEYMMSDYWGPPISAERMATACRLREWIERFVGVAHLAELARREALDS